MARPTGRPVRQELIEAASVAIQQRGPARVSYGDLAEQLGVKAPSVHHHFPRKHDLVAATTRRYREEFRERVEALDAPAGLERIRRYVELFCSPAERDLLCLCGAMAADWADCDDSTRAEVQTFFATERAWLVEQLTHARSQPNLRDDVDLEALADLVLAALEGALLLARVGAPSDPSEMAETLLRLLAAPR